MAYVFADARSGGDAPGIGNLGFARPFRGRSRGAVQRTAFLQRFEAKDDAKPRPEDGFLRHDVLPRIWVISVFAFLLIFADETGTLRLADRIDLALRLMFLRVRGDRNSSDAMSATPVNQAPDMEYP